MKSTKRLLALALVVACAALFGAQNALATESGTTVTNNATISYAVDGVDQDDVTTDTPATFVIDQLVDVLVVSNSNPEYVTPGETTPYLSFTVTNQGNDYQDFVLTLSRGTAENDIYDEDSSILSNLTLSTPTAGYSVANDGTNDYIDELAPGDSVEIRATYSQVPSSVVNGDEQDIILLATARAGHNTVTGATGAGALGAVLVATGLSTPDTAGSVDIVFGDEAGDASGDIARNAAHSDMAQFEVQSASISITKSSFVVYDGVNVVSSGEEPKRIPGACVIYRVVVTNDAGAAVSANLGNITDVLPTAYVTMASNFYDGAGATANGPVRVFTMNSNRANVEADASSPSGVYYTTNYTLSGSTLTVDLAAILAAEGSAPNEYEAGELKPGESVYVDFAVLID
ncbi:hypothetical protein SAMN02745216_02179 [Desulfatibacillum alkenivorans DSM 16219]|jgi:hypothetical protein|uniref:Uncharacterized protein n=1 Tax=Desulfatibacillum alkenivorans DSM 16219 TaxID=1121393 RepID=A0A1M6LTE2_9BACT|nr:hypothetical protein [Desulfatibacillum alkenivorans]SHJ74415.1 hypothetical protein SAMN02745216_02179 [Desulfatibacillum alkenivorans DSM 16219]